MTFLRLLRWSVLPTLCLLALSPLFAQTLSNQQFMVPTNLKISSGRGYTASEFGGILGVADFNRDRRLDILTYYTAPHSLTPVLAILFRNSDGSYTPELVPNLVGNVFDASIQVADVDGDGIPDIVYVINPPQCQGPNCNPEGAPIGDAFLYVYLGNGNGTFRNSMNLDLGNTFAYVDLIADLNKGGKPEFLIEEDYGSAPFTYTVWANQGAGHFKPSAVSFTGNYSVYGPFIAGDFNGDGYADLALNNSSEIEVFLNNKGTGFSPGATYPIPPAQGGYEFRGTIAVGDLNQDGKLDLVASDAAGGGHILLGKGNGTFVPSAFNTAPTQGPANLPRVGLIQIADVNGDRRPDISFIASDFALGANPATYSAPQNTYLEVFPGNGKGTAGNPTVYNLGPASAQSAQLANLSGTGRLDLLVSRAGGFQVASNNGHGSFYAPRQNNTGYPPSSIATKDLNGDGISDVAFVTGNEPLLSNDPYFPASVVVYPGTGRGYFGAPHVYPIDMPSGVIAAGDVNGDGIPDLVIARSAKYFSMCACYDQSAPADLSVLLGNGDGTFRPAMNFKVLGAPAVGDVDTFIQLADVNHDGKLDLIGDWGVALGKGNGSFDPPTALPVPSGTIGTMAAGDFNKDGRLDLAVGSNVYTTPSLPYSGTLYILLGDGKGGFTVKGQAQLANTASIDSVAVADMNKDGESDLVFMSRQFKDSNHDSNYQESLTVRLGDGDGSFGSPISYAMASGGGLPFNYNGQFLIDDFNSDGLPDVLFLGYAAPAGKSALSTLMLLTGTGGGHLNTTPQYYAPNFNSGVVIDVNGDGAPDVVGTTYTGITRLLNTGSRQ